jgi:hypothetical protein
MSIAVTHRFRATRGKGKEEWNDTHVVTGDPDGINVLSYGAKGDGVTDDTAAIQAAINATPNGSTCFVPVGVYSISASLRIIKPIQFVGAGNGRGVDPLGATSGSGAEIVNTASNTDALTVEAQGTGRLSAVVLRDFSVKGNSAGASGHNIVLNAGSGELESCELSNVTTWGAKQDGLRVVGTVFIVSLNRVMATRNGAHGIDLVSGPPNGVSQVRGFGCTSLMNGGTGVYLNSIESSFMGLTAAYNAVGVDVVGGVVRFGGGNNLEDNAIGLRLASSGNVCHGLVNLKILAGSGQNVFSGTFGTVGAGGKHIVVDPGAAGNNHFFISPGDVGTLATTLQGYEVFHNAPWGHIGADGSMTLDVLLTPRVDNTVALGQPSYQWTAVHARRVDLGTSPALSGAVRLSDIAAITKRGHTGLVDLNLLSGSLNDWDDTIVGSATGPTSILSSCVAPSSPVNGQWWVETSGTSPARVCAIKVKDGGTVRTIAELTY